jgi:hypothetical protein
MSSTLDPDSYSTQQTKTKGHDVKSLGPSDSSDSGSDMADGGDEGTGDTSDRAGTGEHMAADEAEDANPGADIEADRIVTAEEAGLGGGLDQAEEARLGITDEEIERRR